MRLNKRKRGQLALLDGMLFFTIVTLSCTALTAYSITNFSMIPDNSTTYRLKYAEAAGINLFGSTVRTATYIDQNGSTVACGNLTFADLLLLRLAGTVWGLPDQNFKDVELKLMTQANWTLHPESRFALMARYGNDTGSDPDVFLSDSLVRPAQLELKSPRFAYSVLREMQWGITGSAVLTLVIWPF